MKNRIILDSPMIEGNRITYSYHAEGEWQKVFRPEQPFFVEYSADISEIPESIAVIPFLCNTLPISWVWNAEIQVPSCDWDFYHCIEAVKQGYKDMYPSVRFAGTFTAYNIIKNENPRNKGAAAFFSGGVDAFHTLVEHLEEKPVLLTVWGADIKFEDETGWQKVFQHLEKTAEEFQLDYVTIKSSFRLFLNDDELNKKVVESGDGWWHGFQHGIGIIGHAAPITCLMGKSTVYFASSFTSKEKGIITCASDPTIDNHLRFCQVKVVHDGYEFDRQDKVHNITSFSGKTGIAIPLRVCWQSDGGENCCECEKCWRTILEITAEGADAKEYGFPYTKKQLRKFPKIYYDKRNIPPYRRDSVYKRAQDTMRQKIEVTVLPKELQWFYKMDIKKLGYHPIYQFLSGCKRKIKTIININK